MEDQSRTSSPKNCESTGNVTFSAEFLAGHLPCESRKYTQTSLFGPEVSPVNHFPSQEKGKGSKTKGTCGLSFSDLFANVDQLSFLVNKLNELLTSVGLTECSPIWKRKTTPAGRLYWELTSSVYHTSESEFSGMPTPTVTMISEKEHPGDRLRIRSGGSYEKQSKRGVWGSINWFQWALLKGLIPTPELAAWLMGYPISWHELKATATPLSPK